MKRKFLLDLGIDEETTNKILNEYTSSVSTLQTQVATLTTERDDYKTQYESTKVEHDTLEQSLNQKNTEIETLKSSSQESSKELARYKNKDVLSELKVDSKYSDFVIHEIESKRGEVEFSEYAKTYLEENKQYVGKTQKVIQTNPNLDGSASEPQGNDAINKQIRSITGRAQ